MFTLLSQNLHVIRTSQQISYLCVHFFIDSILIKFQFSHNITCVYCVMFSLLKTGRILTIAVGSIIMRFRGHTGRTCMQCCDWVLPPTSFGTCSLCSCLRASLSYFLTTKMPSYKILTLYT